MDDNLIRNAKTLSDVLHVLVDEGYLELIMDDLWSENPSGAALVSLAKDYLRDLDVSIHRYEVRHGGK